MTKPIVVSGIRPTGNLHLGNYFGAVRSFLKMQQDYNCYFFIADVHSLTTHPTPDEPQQLVVRAAIPVLRRAHQVTERIDGCLAIRHAGEASVRQA
jgi:tryptophanyl-tRNA synthetase